MKYLISTFVSISILFGFAHTQASSLIGVSYKSDVKELAEPRIDVINDNSFFVLNLKQEGLTINYGDKVELVFGFGIINKIGVYNISNRNSSAFSDSNELAAFIDPADLKYFENKRLRKVIIYLGSKKEVVRIKLQANQLQTK